MHSSSTRKFSQDTRAWNNKTQAYRQDVAQKVFQARDKQTYLKTSFVYPSFKSQFNVVLHVKNQSSPQLYNLNGEFDNLSNNFLLTIYPDLDSPSTSIEQAATPATAVSKRRQKVSAIQIEIYQSTYNFSQASNSATYLGNARITGFVEHTASGPQKA